MIVECGGRKIKLMTKYLRTTLNPIADRYPKTGNKIKIQGHRRLADGEYIIEMVKEYEPAFTKDIDGRDIRITLLSISSTSFSEYHGEDILKAMVK